MNQNICPKCKTLNVPNQSFCSNCGESLAANQTSSSSDLPPTIFSGSPNSPGFIPPNQSNFGAQNPNFNAPPPPPLSGSAAAAAQPKKSRLGLWLAILGAVGVLGLVLVGVVGAGVYFFMNSKKSTYDYNTSTTNTSRSTSPLSNTSTSSSNSSTTTSSSSSMTETDKYRLFYAATKAADQTLTIKISKKIGIIEESGTPSAYYKTFVTGIPGWAAKDTDFIKSIDGKEKALAYINSHM